MNKVLALDPKAIESKADWNAVFPHVGQEKGLFIANFPKRWARSFFERDFDDSTWGFWDRERLKAIISRWEMGNAFMSLEAPYTEPEAWDNSFLNIPAEVRDEILAFGARKHRAKLPTLDDLDPESLSVSSSVSDDVSVERLAGLLRMFLRNSGKVALVDRHQSLLKEDGRSSRFTVFLKNLLVELQNSKCHEILVYTRFESEKFPYMQSEEALRQILVGTVGDCPIPKYGLRYMCCNEVGSKATDLHARLIVTNHVVFSLSDSIGGGTRSRSVTRVSDKEFIEKNIRLWIDGDHDLEVVTSVTFVPVTAEKS